LILVRKLTKPVTFDFDSLGQRSEGGFYPFQEAFDVVWKDSADLREKLTASIRANIIKKS
jgi:hypothetical protein